MLVLCWVFLGLLWPCWGQLDGLLQGLLVDLYPSEAGGAGPECLAHTKALFSELGSPNVSDWALQMVDATGKAPSGILTGNVWGMGNFHECLGVRAALDAEENVTELQFSGKYCLVSFDLHIEDQPSTRSGDFILNLGGLAAGAGMNNIPILIEGICLPSSCSNQDLFGSLNYTFGPAIFPNLESFGCQDGSRRPWGAGDVALTIVLAVIGTCLVAGTALDVWLRFRDKKASGKATKCLLAGSLYTNAEKLLSTRSGSDNIGTLHGIRFLTMSWIVLGHTYEVQMALPTVNPAAPVEISQDFLFNVIMNATPSVDTFFLMSGLLVSYLLLKELQRNEGKFNVIKYFIHRYIRLTPVYAAVIWAAVVFLPRLSSGPISNMGDAALLEPCRRFWWHNLLYVQNLVNTGPDSEGKCIGPSWYLANDMQMYLVAPLVVLPLFHLRKAFALMFSGLLLVAFAAIPGIVIYVEDISGTMTSHDRANPSPHLESMYYIVPWTRFGSYLVGIILGYLLHRLRKVDNFRLPKAVALVGWCTAIVTGLAVIYGLDAYMAEGSPPMPRVAQIVYTSLHRIAWAIAVGWVIFACHVGAGGPVNRILSWSAFVPLGKLTYTTFLVHVFVAAWYGIGRPSATYLDQETQVINFLSHLIVSNLVGAVFCLVFEIPVLNLERLLLFPGPQKSRRGEENPGFSADEKAADGLERTRPDANERGKP